MFLSIYSVLKNKLSLYLFLLGVFVLFAPPVDHDFGWHFKYGEYFLTQGHLLRENIFSYTLPDYEWANSYWLSQIIMAFPVVLFGDEWGTAILSLVFSITASLFYVYLIDKTVSNKPGKVIGLILTFISIRMFILTVRPLFFSTLLFSLLIYILTFQKKHIMYIPVIFILWVNLHADWMLGLFVLAAYAFYNLLETKRLDFKIILIGIFSGLATFINAYGWNLHKTLQNERSALSFTTIAEFLPADFDTWNFSLYVCMIAITFISAHRLIKRLGIWYFFVTVFFIALSIRFTYFYRHMMLMGVFPISLYFGEFAEDLWKLFRPPEQLKILKTLKLVGGALLLFSFIFFAKELYLTLDSRRWAVKHKFPHDAVMYVKQNPLEGKMFNDYNIGGYLIWKLPEYKTYIDGRMPAWSHNGTFPYGEYSNLFKGIKSEVIEVDMLLGFFDEKGIAWALMSQERTAVTEMMVKSGKWEIVYKDEISVIIKKL